MLGSEGNAGERWRTTVGLISKKGTLHLQHTFFCTFLCLCFAQLQRETSSNFLVTRFMDWNVVRFVVHFFSLPLTFTLHSWPLAFLILSPPLQNCHVVLPTKQFLLCFFSLAVDRCRPLSRWASLARRLLSLFLCLSLALFSKFVDMTINLSLILQKTRIQRQFPISIFLAFIDSLVVSALQDAGGYAIYRQNNLELHLGCHTCWLSYFTLVYLWCGRTVGRSVGVRPRDYQIFSDG